MNDVSENCFTCFIGRRAEKKRSCLCLRQMNTFDRKRHYPPASISGRSTNVTVFRSERRSRTAQSAEYSYLTLYRTLSEKPSQTADWQLEYTDRSQK